MRLEAERLLRIGPRLTPLPKQLRHATSAADARKLAQKSFGNDARLRLLTSDQRRSEER